MSALCGAGRSRACRSTVMCTRKGRASTRTNRRSMPGGGPIVRASRRQRRFPAGQSKGGGGGGGAVALACAFLPRFWGGKLEGGGGKCVSWAPAQKNRPLPD